MALWHSGCVEIVRIVGLGELWGGWVDGCLLLHDIVIVCNHLEKEVFSLKSIFFFALFLRPSSTGKAQIDIELF